MKGTVTLIGKGLPYEQEAIQYVPDNYRATFDALMSCRNVTTVSHFEGCLVVTLMDGAVFALEPWDWVLVFGNYADPNTERDDTVNMFYRVKT